MKLLLPEEGVLLPSTLTRFVFEVEGVEAVEANPTPYSEGISYLRIRRKKESLSRSHIS